MPTREAIVNTVIPQDVPKPIPVRVVSTRTSKPKPLDAAAAPNGNQPTSVVSDQAAASATSAESVKLSPQLSALARKEQAFRQREQALKQREKDLEAKLAEADKYSQLKTKLSAKDYSEAESLGLNYEEYTKYLLDKQAGEDPNSQKFKTLEDEIQTMKKDREEENERAFESTKSEYRREIKAAIATNPEFSSIKELKADEHVLQYIVDSFTEDSLEMTVAEACQDIENFLIEQGKVFSALPKLKPAATAPVEEDKRLPPPKAGVSTLTNQMQPTGNAPTPQKSLQHLNEADRYAEARRRVMARRQQQQGT